MSEQREKKFNAFGVQMTVTKNGDTVIVTIATDTSIKLQVDAPAEPKKSPWSGCGAMC